MCSTWAGVVIAPTSAAAWSGWLASEPWRRRPISVLHSSTNASATVAATSTRSGRMQTWPLLANEAQTAACAAAARSASSSTMNGDLPPSSSTHGIRRSPQRAATWRPTFWLPVKKIMSAASTSARPASPSPASTWNTSSGRPSCRHSSATRSDVSGVSCDGFRMTALPATSGATQSAKLFSSGQFHGPITPTTPCG